MTYVVLYGMEGVSEEFRSLPEAKARANILKEIYADVEIDKITDYPGAKPGESDWSQSHLMTISGRSPEQQYKDALKAKLKKNKTGVPTFKQLMGY